ncbi:uncharacterized protein EDB91DRAFT_1165079 [Suillus paluster]|uniref:uncharacterized protein n=1 Tax=Suillus paluster TaxID=48578 RepID=UPI001B868D86|nr:uncharacterized protein EDB91DRAFT_1165079 [Suillus paluster]KAG1726953.1 hypothetical protein EDB91DRAFT_1165079 [Suillus paluster]
MTHNCIDWEATPLRFLTISYGNKKVATQKGPASKVREFKALQSFVHRKFSIKDRPLSSVRFRTTCNLSCTTFEDHSAFEVDEEAWEEEGLRDLVCCLEVWLCDSEEVLPGPSSGVDGELGEEALKPEEESEDTQVHEQVRVSGEREDIEGESNGDVAEDKDSVEDEAEVEQEEEEQEEEKQEEEEKEREEESALRTRPSGRRQRVVVSDDEDSLKEFDRDLAADLQQKNKAAEVVDGPQPSAPIAKNRAGSTSAIHAQDIQRTPESIDIERPVKKEKEPPLAHRVRQSSPVESSHEGRAPSGAASGRPIKQEPIIAARSASQSQATHATQDCTLFATIRDIFAMITHEHT